MNNSQFLNLRPAPDEAGQSNGVPGEWRAPLPGLGFSGASLGGMPFGSGVEMSNMNFVSMNYPGSAASMPSGLARTPMQLPSLGLPQNNSFQQQSMSGLSNIYLGHQALQQQQYPLNPGFGGHGLTHGFGQGMPASIYGISARQNLPQHSYLLPGQQPLQAGHQQSGQSNTDNFLLPPEAADYFTASLGLGGYNMHGRGFPQDGSFRPGAMPINNYGSWQTQLNQQQTTQSEAVKREPQNPTAQFVSKPLARKSRNDEDSEPASEESQSSEEEYRPRSSRSRPKAAIRRQSEAAGTPTAERTPKAEGERDELPQDDASLARAKPFRCNDCGLRFGSSGVSFALSDSRERHANFDSFRKKHLSRHRYIHVENSQKPHPCPIPGCTRRFPRSDNMRVHYRAHLKQIERDKGASGSVAAQPAPQPTQQQMM